MSIFPAGKKPDDLVFAFQVAALNLDIPNDLTAREDAEQWAWYVRNLGRGQQVRDFGRALDQLQEQVESSPDISREGPLAQAKIYAKWTAASILSAALHGAFHRYTEETFGNPQMFKSGVEEMAHHLVEFLESVNSADLPAWKKRQDFLRRIDKAQLIAVLDRIDPPQGKQTVQGAKP